MNSDSKTIDLSYLREMSGNNKAIMLEMVDIFLEQNPEFIQGISNSFKNNEWANLGAIAHKAKSSFRIMGMNELGECLEKLEHYSKGNKKVELQRKLDAKTSLNEQELRIWKNIQNENINDVRLEFIPKLVNYFLAQSPLAITDLKKALSEL